MLKIVVSSYSAFKEILDMGQSNYAYDTKVEARSGGVGVQVLAGDTVLSSEYERATSVVRSGG